MIYINVFFIVFLFCMAILSRKYFSKYKGRGMFSPLAGFLAARMRKAFFFEYLKKYVRRAETLSSERVMAETEGKLAKVIDKALTLFLLLNILLLVMGNIPGEEKKENSLRRPDYGENPVEYNISIDKDGKKKNYALSVNPREYDDVTFRTASEELYEKLNDSLKGKNTDLSNVCRDLSFPAENDEQSLSISWKTEDPDIISSYGRVNNKGLTKPVTVEVKAVVTDGIHDREFVWNVTVIPYSAYTWTGRVEEELQDIEARSRTNEVIDLPEKIDGASVSAEEESNVSMICKLFIFGILLIGVYIFAIFNRIHRKGLERQEEMLKSYSFFVSSIVLRLGAGLSVREAMLRICREMKEKDQKNSLYEELNYVSNSLNAGRDERTVYTEMGRSAGPEEYSRLMTLICRNLEKGNSNLLELLRREEKDAFNLRKIRARKKGEEAAEKLLIPMFILLVAVVGIVMFPALRNL
ncbi:type II secretion system protein F (GspF) [Eubacterium ruminantium]|nr:type II secretion system protein F (GspF) [Eubacterium ruminantium]